MKPYLLTAFCHESLSALRDDNKRNDRVQAEKRNLYYGKIIWMQLKH